MPPGVQTLKIRDMIDRVKSDLQNRSDVDETQTNPEMRPSAWIRDTLRELTADFPYPELQVPDPPIVTIGPGLGWQGSNFAYQISSFVKPGDDFTVQEDPVIFLTPSDAATVGIVATATDTVAYPMDFVTPKAIASILFIPGGVPFKYSRYGTLFWFGTQPGKDYSVYVPYQLRHPFLAGDDLVNSPIRIPDDWLDILSYGAAERGAIKLRWNDQATYLHNILWGDPKSQTKDGEMGSPGLLAARHAQIQRDRRLSTIQIVPGAQRY
jgi:hypothetical protein